VFANLDLVASTTPQQHERFRQAIGRDEDDPADHLAGLCEQLGWLREVGFEQDPDDVSLTPGPHDWRQWAGAVRASACRWRCERQLRGRQLVSLFIQINNATVRPQRDGYLCQDRRVRSGPSVTARAVALGRSRLVRSQTSTGDPEAENRLYAGLGGPVWWPVGARWQRRVAARTRFLDDVTLSAIDAGITQVVIVGAGYDGRALRFAQPGVRFFEVDHPATQQDKRRRVQALGVSSEEITYVAYDLTDGDLAGALAAAGHAHERASLFICEGLLLYLTPPVIEELLRALRSCAAVGSLLALSAGERLPGAPAVARARVDAQRLLLAAIGEPRRSRFEPGEVNELLQAAGWSTVRERVRARGGRKGMLVLAQPKASIAPGALDHASSSPSAIPTT